LDIRINKTLQAFIKRYRRGLNRCGNMALRDTSGSAGSAGIFRARASGPERSADARPYRTITIVTRVGSGTLWPW
jgi:hypothetical protein